jgi:hypothetical protein
MVRCVAFSVGAKIALSISSGALRLCADQCAARTGESSMGAQERGKTIWKMRILSRQRAALL